MMNGLLHLCRLLLLIVILQVSASALCSDNNQSFIVNEVNTKQQWVELYANPSKLVPVVTDWSVTVRASNKTRTKTFSFNLNTDGYFYIIDFADVFGSSDWNNDVLDILVKDASGAIVDYFNLGIKGKTPYVIPIDAKNCGLDVACKYFERFSSGQTNIFRSPDGSCVVEEGKNWQDSTIDGSNDGGVFPLTSANYRFDECFWDGSLLEVKDSSGNNYHGTSFLSNTSAEAKIFRSGDFINDGIEDYLTLDYRALNGLDDFSISVWMKTSNTGPQIVVSGAKTDAKANEAVMWFRNGTRFAAYIKNEFGIIDLKKNIADGSWHHFVWTRQRTNNCAYIDGQIQGCVDLPIGSLGALSIAPNGFIIGQDQDKVGGEFDPLRDYEGLLDEVKIFNTTLGFTRIQAIYNNEAAGKNYDGTVRVLPVCAVVTPKNGNYNAIDRINTGCSAVTHWSNTLSTRLVNDDINLSVLAKDKATDLPLEANITQVTLVHYPAGNNNACSGTSLASIDVCTNNCGLTDANGCLSISVNKSLNQRASRCVEVVIKGKDKTDTTGVSESESNASDNFAIRPQTYNCDGIAASTLVSEKAYSSTFKATPLNLSTKTPFYTTPSVVLSAKKYMRTGELNTSLSGGMSPSTLNFVDGNASAFVSFNDACDVGIDLNDSTWANVDSDDTAEIDRVIHAECRRLFRPDHFLVELTRPLLENNTTSFTYLANLSGDVNMSAWARNLNATITAKGESNTTMLNYSYPIDRLYANNVRLLPALSLPVKHSAATKRVDLSETNSSDMSGFVFVNGVATFNYPDVAFNYYRDYKTPLAPFVVNGYETYFSLEVRDTLYTPVVGDDNTSSDANATFYYGRLRTTGPVATTYLPITYPLYIDIYNGSSWSINTLHNGNSAGSVFDSVASSNTSIDNLIAGFAITPNTVLSGRQELSITAAPADYAQIHLKIQEWLWFLGPYALAYDDDAGSDCEMHPCFDFSLLSNDTALKIQSGDFNGTVIPDVNRSEYFKKGTKLFR